MEIKIETNYIPLLRAYDDYPEGFDLKLLPSIEHRDAGFSDIVAGLFSFSVGVSGSILASWIYDKLKRVKTNRDKLILKINEKEVQNITKDEITKIVEREIEIYK
jgi:hypothetical protein